jgi:hypothetical protein
MRSTAIIAALSLVGLYFGSAMAEPIPAQKPDAVEGKCGESGGLYFPKTGPNSTYGCINEDGSGIVCGGVTAKDKRTCDTFLQTPPRLPTRWEAELADRAKVDSNAKQGK